jgi:hypothetical protein
MALYHSPSIIRNGLILHLDAANPKSYNTAVSTSTWVDITGKGNSGTLTNSPTYTGTSITFNGTNQYINAANNPAYNFGTGNFSISFWIYPTAWADGASRGVIEQKTGDATNGWTFYDDGGQPSNLNARLGLQNNFESVSAVATNRWQNWTFVRSGSNIFWYLNGVLDATGSNSANLTDTSNFHIGYAQTWGGYCKGNISIVQIYSRALSLSEIQQNYSAYANRHGLSTS